MDGLLTRLDRAQKKIIDLECTYEKKTHNVYRKTNRNMERQKDGKYEWLKRYVKVHYISKERIERMRNKQYSKKQQMRIL